MSETHDKFEAGCDFELDGPEPMADLPMADEEEGLTSIGLCCACVYWHCAVGEYREAQSGECRRHPPTVRQGRIITSYNVGPDCEEDVPLTAWPVTRGSDWCGEWRAEP